MLNSKEFTTFETKNKKVVQCSKKCSYKNKEAKEIQEKLDEKYKAKISAALKLPAKEMIPKIRQLNIEKRTEMKMNDMIRRHYECMLNTCTKDITAFMGASINLARYIIADSEQRLKAGGLQPNVATFLRSVIRDNKQRIKLLKKSVTVPRLIDILYPS